MEALMILQVLSCWSKQFLHKETGGPVGDCLYSSCCQPSGASSFMRAEKLHVESENVEKGTLELIAMTRGMEIFLS